MSTNNIAKSQSLVRALQDQLSKRLSSYTIVESLINSAGDTLMVSQSATPTAGQNNCAIRIGFQDTQFNDVIGNPQNVYTPMRADIIQESTAASASVRFAAWLSNWPSASNLAKWALNNVGILIQMVLFPLFLSLTQMEPSALQFNKSFLRQTSTGLSLVNNFNLKRRLTNGNRKQRPRHHKVAG